MRSQFQFMNTDDLIRHASQKRTVTIAPAQLEARKVELLKALNKRCASEFDDFIFSPIDYLNLMPWNTGKIVDVIFNKPATIVKWSDGTKTVVKCTDKDEYSECAGLALCTMKKLYGNNFHKELTHWMKVNKEREERKNVKLHNKQNNSNE